MNYDEYRQTKMEQGRLFEDFVRRQLPTVGMHINIYSTRDYQLEEGESPNGAEVKFDDIMERTGNLWIETAEKARPRNGFYAVSGIYRNNIAFYIQGDYKAFFVFNVNVLRCEVESGRYRKIENKTKTSVGILLPVVMAERIAQKVETVNNVSRLVAMSKDLRQEACKQLRKPTTERTLFQL